MLGQKVEIDGIWIHYERVGTGPEKVLLLPGGLGTSRTDFTEQLEKFDRNKFTLIAWDPPGYGYVMFLTLRLVIHALCSFSRPPERQWSKDIYEKDAELANKLMKNLGIRQYSLIGWSDGAKTALLMAIKYQSTINKIVVFGAMAYMKPENIKALSKTRNIKIWNPSVRQWFEKVYGNELQELWSKLIDHYETNMGDVCKDSVKLIRCPTFILHGDCDPLVDGEHPKFLLSQIPNARLHRFRTGSHNMHQEFADQFNELVQDFLLESFD